VFNVGIDVPNWIIKPHEKLYIPRSVPRTLYIDVVYGYTIRLLCKGHRPLDELVAN